MDEMNLPTQEAQEVFQRVWQRVMGAKEAQVISQQEPAQPVMAPQSQAQPAMAPRPSKPPRRPPPPETPVCPLPRQIEEALAGWQFCRLLARRSGPHSRSLNAMAAQLHSQAKALSAAYFLHSGVRHWPVDRLSPPGMPSYMAGLRHRYQLEQSQGEEFRRCAQTTRDPALAQLYRQLAQDSQNRCHQLRRLLEQTGP